MNSRRLFRQGWLCVLLAIVLPLSANDLQVPLGSYQNGLLSVHRNTVAGSAASQRAASFSEKTYQARALTPGNAFGCMPTSVSDWSGYSGSFAESAYVGTTAAATYECMQLQRGVVRPIYRNTIGGNDDDEEEEGGDSDSTGAPQFPLDDGLGAMLLLALLFTAFTIRKRNTNYLKH